MIKKISFFLVLLFLIIPTLSACAAIKFKEFSTYETVLKTKIGGINITLLAETADGKRIQTQELPYFEKIIKSSLKHFPEFREERFPKPYPLKSRADKKNLTIFVVAKEETKQSICRGHSSPRRCKNFLGIFDQKGNTIFLFSDNPFYYNFMFEGPVLIHEMFHFQTTLYDEARIGRKMEEELADQFETFIFFKIQ